MKADIAALLDLASGVLFILALKGLSSPATSAPTTITEEIALVTAINGVCSAGVTPHTTK